MLKVWQSFRARKEVSHFCPTEQLQKQIQRIVLIPSILGALIVINLFAFRFHLSIPGGTGHYEMKMEFGWIVIVVVTGIVNWKYLLLVAALAPATDILIHAHNPSFLHIDTLFIISWTIVVLLCNVLFLKKKKKTIINLSLFFAICWLASVLLNLLVFYLFWPKSFVPGAGSVVYTSLSVMQAIKFFIILLISIWIKIKVKVLL